MADTTSTARTAAQPSPDGTAIQSGGTLTDFSGNTYSLISGQNAVGGNVVVDGGSSDSTTASLLVYVHSLVFELTSTNTWRVVNKADTASPWETVNGDPRGASPPLTPAGESPDLASVTSGGTLVDNLGNKWSLSNGVVLLNGVAPPTINGQPNEPGTVDMLVYASNAIVAHTNSTPYAWQQWVGTTAQGSWTGVPNDPRTLAPAIVPGAPVPTSGLTAVDTSTGLPLADTSQAYSGPVAGITHQYINVTSDNLSITTSTDGWFLHSGPGTDAMTVHGGNNILDGGTGSNFLTGGSGTDTFFVDARNASADIWSTLVNFHAGDSATLWGVNAAGFTLQWQDGQGASGFTGLTLHANSAGKPTATLTLVGFTQADMASGRLSTSFGTDPASGSSYLYIHANS